LWAMRVDHTGNTRARVDRCVGPGAMRPAVASYAVRIVGAFHTITGGSRWLARVKARFGVLAILIRRARGHTLPVRSEPRRVAITWCGAIRVAEASNAALLVGVARNEVAVVSARVVRAISVGQTTHTCVRRHAGITGPAVTIRGRVARRLAEVRVGLAVTRLWAILIL
jgi:hypothetical protein